MSVTIDSITRLDSLSFRIAYSSDLATPVTFRVVVAGKLVDTRTSNTGSGSSVITVGAGESPYFEVLDVANQRPQFAAPGRLTFHWRRINGAVSYLVQESISAVWTTVETRRENGENNHVFLSRWLEDCTSHSFRVVPVDAGGVEGDPIAWTAETARHPDVPAVSYAWDADTSTLTIA